MLKRSMDLLVASSGLLLLSPVLVLIALLIWAYDFHSPFYVAPRVGRNGRPFPMVKFRSMIVNADRVGGTSTSAADRRITPIGRLVRRCKLDEIVQLWNVLRGDMSLVGPRPNVQHGAGGTDTYTQSERRLLSVRPGITDFASIVFADEGQILHGHLDPDAAYDRLIRPWKSRLGLFYIDRISIALDLQLIALTAVAIVSRAHALAGVVRSLRQRGAPETLLRVASRQSPLEPVPPPGAELSASDC